MITALRMVNCQSLQDVTFEFASDKVNVIAASLNNTGKSVLFRMIRVTLTPKFFSRERLEKLIRRGCEYAEIAFAFADGAYGLTRVYPGKVLYAYTPSVKDQQCVWFEEVPPEMIKNMGFVVTEGAKKFIPNILDDEQDLALVDLEDGSDVSLLNFMLQHEQLNTLIGGTEELIKFWRLQQVEVDCKLRALQQTYSNLQFVNEEILEDTLETDEAAYTVASTVQPVIYRLQRHLTILQDTLDYDFLVEVVDIALTMDTTLTELKRQRVLKEPEPYDLVDVIEVGEKLVNTMQRYKPFRPELLNTVEIAITMENAHRNLSSCKVVLPPPADDLINGLEVLDTVATGAKTVLALLSKKDRTEQEIEELETMFRESGEIYDCPVHRKVVYDGKECVPCCD